jgi:hypothetical protein
MSSKAKKEIEVMRSLYRKEHLKIFESKNLPKIVKLKMKVKQLEREQEKIFDVWEEQTRSCPFMDKNISLDNQVKYELFGNPCCHPRNKEESLYGNCSADLCPLTTRGLK